MTGVATGASSAWSDLPSGGPPRWGRRQSFYLGLALTPALLVVAMAVFTRGSGHAVSAASAAKGRFFMAVVHSRHAGPCRPGEFHAPESSGQSDPRPCLTLGPTLVTNRNVLDVQAESFVSSQYDHAWFVVVHATKAALSGLVKQAGSARDVAVVLDGKVLNALPLGSLGAVRDLRANQYLVTETEANRLAQRIWGHPAGYVELRRP